VLRKASGVVVPNELLKSELAERISSPITIIRNPVQLDLYETLRASVPSREYSPLRPWSIAYTGSIYEAQLDAVRNCARGLDVLRGRGIDVRLHLYTAQSEASLHAQGIPDSVHIHPAVKPLDASRIQCEADILLLPLAFATRYPELIRTSAPGKLGLGKADFCPCARRLLPFPLCNGPAMGARLRHAGRVSHRRWRRADD
jgi:hypothetical protein